MSTFPVSIPQVAEVLRTASFPDSVQACAYRMQWSEVIGDVAEVVIVLKSDEWDSAAERACAQARVAGLEAFAGLDITPILICRTRAEHLAAAKHERNIWTPVAHDSCT